MQTLSVRGWPFKVAAMSVADSSTTRSDSGESQPANDVESSRDDSVTAPAEQSSRARELGGPKGPEPTRYGDWERKGRCSDF